mgnify:CR=1 FL=1
METINVGFGRINGVKVWPVEKKKKNGFHIGKSVDKSTIDKVLAPTDSNEAYFYAIARYMSRRFFSMLDEHKIAYNKSEFEFICEGQKYSHK